MPGNLLAAMQAPTPLPHIIIPRFAFLLMISFGYRLCKVRIIRRLLCICPYIQNFMPKVFQQDQ